MEYGIITLVSVAMGFIAGYLIQKKLSSGSQVITLDELGIIKNELSGYKKKSEMLCDSLAEHKALNEKQNNEIVKVKSDLATKNERIVQIEKFAEEKKTELEKMNKKLNEEFKNIANGVMANSSENFKKMVINDLGLVLDPLKQNLMNFELKLGENQHQQTGTLSALKEQVNQLTSMNQVMSTETKNLTRVLKGESKIRGNWGEMILETILERSGLIKDEHYSRERILKSEEGSSFRPDVIINLPEKRNLVIDSKLSLIDYERFSNSEEDVDRAIHLKKHAESVRNHIKQLSVKDYQNLHGINAPDFVIMFIPLESAFHVAIEFDREIFGEAYEKNIILTAPTTLIPTLKIIHNIWRQETQNKNAMVIAEAGGKLYDKFVGFADNMKKIGSSIDNSKKIYNEAYKQLTDGRVHIL
jgi:DNA recombination protein RmuC